MCRPQDITRLGGIGDESHKTSAHSPTRPKNGTGKRRQGSIFDNPLNRFFELGLADDSANDLHFPSLTVHDDP